MGIATIHAGHGGIDPGAIGNGRREADIARLYSNTLVHMTGAFDATDNSARSVNENLANIVRNVESFKGSGYDISLHMNAATPQATGVEVFAFGNDRAAMAMAGKISADLARIYGIPNRGAKDGSGLYVIRNTTRPMLLIELGFITNANDLKQVVDKITPACESIVRNLGGTVKPPVTPPTQSSEKLINVVLNGLSLPKAQKVVIYLQDTYGDNGKRWVKSKAIEGVKRGDGAFRVEIRGVQLAVAQKLVQVLQDKYCNGEKILPLSAVYGEASNLQPWRVEFRHLELPLAQAIVNELHRDLTSDSGQFVSDKAHIKGYGREGKVFVEINPVSFNTAELLVTRLQNEYAINRKLVPIGNIVGVGN